MDRREWVRVSHAANVARLTIGASVKDRDSRLAKVARDRRIVSVRDLAKFRLVEDRATIPAAPAFNL